ncbi:MAG: hypothetical protein GY754_10245 [bacterium]|nr:hypothetical protein [bacterium]
MSNLTGGIQLDFQPNLQERDNALKSLTHSLGGQLEDGSFGQEFHTTYNNTPMKALYDTGGAYSRIYFTALYYQIDTINFDFRIIPIQDLFDRIIYFFTKSVKTKSNKFNKIFHTESDDLNALQILLTPDICNYIIKLREMNEKQIIVIDTAAQHIRFQMESWIVDTIKLLTITETCNTIFRLLSDQLHMHQ